SHFSNPFIFRYRRSFHTLPPIPFNAEGTRYNSEMKTYCSASNGAVNQLRRGCPHADGVTTKRTVAGW
ncbi:hypothetical protein ACPZ8S_28120, partial [Klebsiella pneumoniae subsp. pneumoniae]